MIARLTKAQNPAVPIILFTQYAGLGNYVVGPNLPVDRIVSKSEARDLMGHVRSLIPV